MTTGQQIILLLISNIIFHPCARCFQTNSCDFTRRARFEKSREIQTGLFSSVHMFSLQYPLEEVGTFSKPVKDVWRWKDSVLGDGRDFFVPKPKTLGALNSYLIDHSSLIKECSVLSNCARLEFVIWTNDTSREAVDTMKESISCCLVEQVVSYQKRPFPMLRDQLSRFDSAFLIDRNIQLDTDETNLIPEIKSHLNYTSGVEDVCRHLCVVAAGMAARPNRPERDVPFRPFSSRDAHILLQLKRTREVSLGSHVEMIFDAALSAGKSARNVEKVPQLKALLQYGSGNNNKYSLRPPTDVTETAADGARRLAIEPTVKDCVQSFSARSRSNMIVKLRDNIEALAQSPEERKWVKEKLHQPTLQLRQGQDVDIDAVRDLIENELLQQREVKGANVKH
mmetsp:Transcript_15908/g.24088  ORF Transcript_15908/g.24088 Transcript_15908/m.24088 type:complete len:396 (+) Transcript_15908:30-1217(+)